MQQNYTVTITVNVDAINAANLPAQLTTDVTACVRQITGVESVVIDQIHIGETEPDTTP